MGNLTHVTLHNDRLHDMEADPKGFAHELFALIDRSTKTHMPVHGGGITVQPYRHADDHTVLVHRGNTLIDIGHRKFDEMSYPIAAEYLKTAQREVTWARRRLKERVKKLALGDSKGG